MQPKLYDTILTGQFIDRPNRFISHIQINGKIETCHMPNPGRMRELLFPGTTMYVTPNTNPKAKTAYRVIGVAKGEDIFYLDTSKCNDVAAYMVQHHMIPGWERYVLLDREVTMGDSRFDLLLGNPETGEAFPVEVKSCSLAGQRGAMFPDAPTERGRKHLLHLAKLGKEGSHAGLLILVHYGKAQWFLPDFHTDPDFAQAFYDNMSYVDWKAAAISWTPAFTMPESTRLIPTSRKTLQEEMGNRGNYFIILHLPEEKDIEIGSRGMMHFPAGYYVYVGSAKKNLDQRINHHRHLRKKMHWHMDYLRREADFIGAIPIRTKSELEHDMARAVSAISDWTIPSFGCTDCHCATHLFGFHENPMHLKRFTLLEEYFEIDRLDGYCC